MTLTSGGGQGEPTFLARDARLDGHLIGNEVIVLGYFKGEAHGRYIRVEASAEVEAVLNCEVAEILGRFRGTIEAQVLRFGSAAVARGVFHPSRLAIAEGAVVDGSFGPSSANVNPSATRAEPLAGAPTAARPAQAPVM